VFLPEKYLGGDSTDFNTLGSEAMEGAIKLARQVSISFSDFGRFLQ
jgi:acetylornithine/succinyldiaminopimelate/putrescine aminotransferase